MSKHYQEAKTLSNQNEVFPSVGDIQVEEKHVFSSTKKEIFLTANSTHPTNSNTNSSIGIHSLIAQVESNANTKSISQPIEGTSLNMNSLFDADLFVRV